MKKTSLDKVIDSTIVQYPITYTVIFYFCYIAIIFSYVYKYPTFGVFVTDHQALIASTGAVIAACIAYWGISATARQQKQKEDEATALFRDEIFPTTLAYELKWIKSFLKTVESIENVQNTDVLITYIEKSQFKQKITGITHLLKTENILLFKQDVKHLVFLKNQLTHYVLKIEMLCLTPNFTNQPETFNLNLIKLNNDLVEIIGNFYMKLSNESGISKAMV